MGLRNFKTARVLVLGLILGLTGCGGGGGGGTTVPPTAAAPSSVTPWNGSSGVALNQVISAIFPASMNGATITTATFTVKAPGSSPIAGAVTYDIANRIARFTPMSNLASGTTFIATLSTAIRDLSGYPLAADYVWSFTTGSTVDGSLAVSSTSPADGASAVPTNRAVTTSFRSAMDGSTLTTATFTVTVSGGAAVAGTVFYNAVTRVATFTPTATLSPNTTFVARLSTDVKDAAGNPFANPMAWTFTTGASPAADPPSSVNPGNDASAVALNQIVSATFAEAMDGSTITFSTFTVTGPSGLVGGSVAYDGTNRIARFTPTSNYAPNTTFTARLTTGVRNAAGFALAAAHVWSFTTGATVDGSLAVSSTDPADGPIGVSTNHAIGASFRTAMDGSTLTTATFTVTISGGAPVPGTVFYDPTTRVATFTPTNLLPPNTTFIATLTTGVRDASGNPFTNPMVWSFTTGSSPAAAPPSSVNPGNDASAVALNQIVSATFLAAMNGSTLTTATFTLTGPGGLVAGTVAYDGTNRIARFTPARNYAANTTFTARLTTGVRDANGYALANAHVWSFTTGSAVDGSLAVSSTNPADGASGVPTNQTVAASFRTMMDGSTLTTATFTLNLSGGAAVSGNVAYNAVNRVVTFTPAALLPASSTFVARLSTAVQDASGHPFANSYAWSFSTGDAPAADPPSSVNPGNDASAVALNQIVSATFLAAMDGTTLTTATFTVTGPGGLVAGTVAYDAPNRIARFTPAGTYAPNTTFTARLTTAVRNTAGYALAVAHVWSFTTGSAVDGSLAVSSTNPADGASGVPTSQTVAASFRTAMDGSTLTTATFTVTISGGAAVTGAVAYDAVNRIVTFTPAALLPASATFVARLSTAVRDASANPFANPYTWSFSTGTAPAAAPPTSVNPGNDASAVALNQIVSATFSEAMDGSTLTTATFTVTGPGGLVAGTVAYDALNRIARFTPASNYAANTLFTARLTTAVENAAGNALATAHVWSFTTGSAVDGSLAVSFTNPSEGARDVPTNESITVTFRTAMDGSTLTTATFTVSASGGSALTGTVVYDAVTRAATFRPADLLAPNTLFVAQLSTAVKDASGHSFANPYSWQFESANQLYAQEPNPVNPANGAVGVSLDQLVTATFPEAMNGSTLTSATFTLTGPGTTPVTGTVAYNAFTSVASFTPSTGLSSSTTYTATLTTGVKNANRYPLAQAFVWSFTTVIPPVYAARPTSVSPSNGATAVALNQTVVATFPVSMDASTFTTVTFTVARPGGSLVAGTVTYDVPNRVARFAPASNYTTSTTFTATLTTAVKDQAGHALQNAEVWSFTTGRAPDLGPLAVTSTDPTDGATGVPINQLVVATFRSPMDGSTLTTSTFTLSDGGSGPVTGTIAYDAVNRVATFTPASFLTTDSTFIARFSTAVKDVEGSALADPYVWGFSTSSSADTTPPTVTSTVPADGTTEVALNQSINALFSKSMNPTTLTSVTFTVSGPGAEAVTGTVTYDLPSRIGTFEPSNLLSPSSTYTPTITVGAEDLAGNPLAVSAIWSFSTRSTASTTIEEEVPLGAAGRFAVLAGSTVTNAGPTVVNGDLGVSPGSAVTAFPPGVVNGSIHAGDSDAAIAMFDLTSAYNDAAGRSTAPVLVAGNLGGLTLTPGLYRCATTIAISSGDLTLDGKGDAKAAFIFQIGETLTTTSSRKIFLIGGAKATNVYWQVGTSATLGDNSVFKGNILADQSITINTGTTMDGRALARIGAVALNACTVTVPTP